MRLLQFILILASCLCPLVFGQNSSQHGIQVTDLDRKADPCVDFPQYANGTWHAKNPIPPYMDRWSRRWQSGENSKDRLKDILQEVSKRPDWPKSSVEQLIGDFYASCMDERGINEAGLTPARPMLEDIDAMKSPADLHHMIARFHELGIFVPFGLLGQPDNHNPGETIANVFANGLGLPDRDYYLKTEQRFQDAREKYLVHVTKMFKLAGYDDAKAKAAANTVFQLEKKLAENSLDNVALRDPQATDHKTTYVALKKMAPGMDWDGYFTAGGIPQADLNVSEPRFMQEVERQLRETPLQDWKVYLRWQLLHSTADTLPDDFVNENFSFYGKFLSGSTEIKPRWKRCAESTDQLLGEALGQKYVEKYFPPVAKARMQEMVRNLLAAMRDDILSRPWMSDDTKEKAMAKIATFNPKIGYPDKWKDYSHVDVRRDAFFEAMIAGRKFVEEDDRSTIGKAVDRGRWGMTPPTSDAYYNPLMNEIVFPAGILQPPAFDMNAGDAVNYGAIGVVIGHEISHGFDDEGAQFDFLGRLRNWWTDADQKNFQARGACVANQFDHYFIEKDIHHNGKLVLGESIGDLGGAKIAFLAYQKSLEGKPRPADMDGFTPEQQFFIAWGQFRGDEIRPEAQRLMVQSDPHPIAKYRVIGPLSNLPEFQKAWSCKADSPMVRPEGKRCEVW